MKKFLIILVALIGFGFSVNAGHCGGGEEYDNYTVTFTNICNSEKTFKIYYFDKDTGVKSFTEEIDVDGGDTVTVDVPFGPNHYMEVWQKGVSY